MKKSIFAPWLVRFYEWYHTYRRPSWWKEYHRRRQEDFCHFGRVVFIWGPLYWFLHRRLVLGIRPWLPVALAFYGLLLTVYPMVMSILGLAVFWFWAMIQPKVLKPVWGVLTRSVAGRVRIGHVLLVALFAGLAYFSPGGSLTVLIYFAAIVLASAIILLIVVAVLAGLRSFHRFLRRWIQFSISIRFRVRLPKVRVAAPPVPAPVRSAAANVGGIFSTVWHFLVVLKRRTICPWVTFKDGRIEFEFASAPTPPSALADDLQKATKAAIPLGVKVAAVISKPKPKPKKRRKKAK